MMNFSALQIIVLVLVVFHGVNLVVVLIMQAFQANGKPIIEALYDDDCGFCTQSMKVMRFLNWRNRIQFIPASRAAHIYNLPIQQLRSMFHVKEHDRFKTGFFGWRAILEAVPVTFIVLRPIMHTWFGVWLGQKVYHYVASHRNVIPGLCQSDNTTCNAKVVEAR